MSLLVGFGHKARHGKDTVARLIHEALPKHTTILRFSGDLKAYARMLGMRGKDSYMLQCLGTAFRRVDENVFIRCLGEQIEEAGAPCVLIPDVRYKNEADWIRGVGGLLVRVTRTEPNGLRFVASDRPADHPSETELDHYDGWGWYIDAPSGSMALLEEESTRLARAIAARIGAAA